MQIALTFLLVGCFVYLLYSIFSRSGGETAQYVVTEDGEERTSVYRTQEVAFLMSIIDYWLADILPEDTQPHVYSTDDYTMSFVTYATANGLLRCGINWAHNTLDLHYSKHTEAEGRCIELRRTIHRDNDSAIVDFLLQVKEADMSLEADAANLLNELKKAALSPAAIEEMEDISTGQAIITLFVYLTSYFTKTKHPDKVLTALYKEVALLIHQRFGDDLQKFVTEHSSEPTATTDSDTNPSE